MTEQQLKQAQEYKRTLERLDNEIAKFDKVHELGINVFLPNVGTLLDDVKQVFLAHRERYNELFRKL